MATRVLLPLLGGLACVVRVAAIEVSIAAAGNSCPSGSAKLTSTAACRAAIDLLGYDGDTFECDEDESSWPSVCYFCAGVAGCSNGFWFNSHSSGAENGGASPVCASGLEPLDVSTSTLFIGDSDVDYWPATDATFDVSQNVAVGGYTCKNVKNEMNEMLSSFGPDLKWVVLVCGENDLWSKSVAQTFSRFSKVVSKATAVGTRVLYMGTKPEPSTSNLWDEYEEYDALIRTLATSLAATAAETGAPPPLVMVDVYPAFEALGNPDSLYRNDNLHLSSDGGYAYWNQWALAALDDTRDTYSTCVRWLGDECDELQSTCVDDPAWYKNNRPDKDCDWVARKGKCNKMGNDGTLSNVGCPVACGTCGATEE